MILSIEGLEKSGKTTLAFSSPLKIVGFLFDLGYERAIKGARYKELFEGLDIHTVKYPGPGVEPEQVWSGHDITIYEMPKPLQIDEVRIRGARALWHYFLKLYGPVLLDPTVKTIVVDTMTVARRIKADAYLEDLQERAEKNGQAIRERLLQIEYGGVNDPIRELYVGTAAQGKNLIAVHHLDDERQEQAIGQKDGSFKKETVLTGKKILEGLKNTYNYVDVAVRMEKQAGKIGARVQVCGYNIGLEGMVLANCTWDSLVGVISGSLGDRVQFDLRNGRV